MEEFRDSNDSETPAYVTLNGESHVTNGINEHESTLNNLAVHDGEAFGRETEQQALQTAPKSGLSRRRLFLLTASDKDCAKTQMLDLSLYLQTKLNEEGGFLDDLAFTLTDRRSMLDWRLATSASSVHDLRAALDNNDVHLNRASKTPVLGFVFTGQGAQWATMGQGLLVHPIFASTLREADGCLRSLGAGWSLLGEKFKDSSILHVTCLQGIDELAKPAAESNIDNADISQPATTAIQIGIVVLFQYWNIKPRAVVGHSSGEIAAAFSAGILDMETCMRIAFYRGALTLKLKQDFPKLKGGMLAIGASVKEAQRLVEKVREAKVVIACMNGPSLVTASGDRDGISQLQQLAESEGFFARQLRVDIAYHSHHMENVAEIYRKSLGEVRSNLEEEVTFYSSLHGKRVGSEALEATYWVANLTNPVQFTQALHNLCIDEEDANIDTLVEIGPHSALQAPIQDLLKANTDWGGKFKYLSCLKRGEDACSTVLSAVADLVSHGYPVNISRVNLCVSRKVLVDMPAYPWMHKRRHWYESRLSLNHRFRKFPRNDLLGNLVNDVNDLEPRWRSKLLLSEVPWLRDHKVQSTTVFPLAGYISIAIQAAYQQAMAASVTVTSRTKYNLREITVQRSLVLVEASHAELSITFKRQREGSRGGLRGWSEFTIYSCTESGAWSEHCRGLIMVTSADVEPNAIDGKAALESRVSKMEDSIAEMHSVCRTAVDCDLYYQKISDLGLQFGPNFQGLRAGLAGPDRCIGTVQIPDTAVSMPRNFESGHIIHPTTLDSCFQSASLALKGIDLEFSTLYVPTYVKKISISHGIPEEPGHELTTYTTATMSESGKELKATYLVTDACSQDKQPMIEIDGFISSALPRSDHENPTNSKRGLCFSPQYVKCTGLLTSAQYPKEFPPTGQEPQAREQNKMAERAAFYLTRTALAQTPTCEIPAHGHLRKLYDYLATKVAQVFESGIPYQTPDWIDADDVEQAEFLDMVESSSAHGKLVCEMGKNLAAIFRGKVEPLSIMLKDALLERFYQDCIALDQSYTRCSRWIKELGYQSPQMRILEIGAGTGSATVHVLNALTRADTAPNFASLDYSDISAGFFERAQEKLERWRGLVNYRRLDIEQDPIEQGFEPESYDLIIASEVLHATTHMENTMRNVRTLLKSAGKLVIIETTLSTIHHNIVFGTLPGR